MPAPSNPAATPPPARGLLAALLDRPSAANLGSRMRAWSGSWRGAGLALFILCLAVYLPGLWSIPPVDRDESRFAQASRTMLESGDWIVPRIQDTPRLNKPPLIYWLQATSARLLGDAPGPDGLGQWGNGNIWVFRLPSVLAAIGSILLTWRAGRRLFDPRAAALGAALLAVCPMVVWDAHQARADQLLLFATTGAMWAMAECWLRFRRGHGAGWRWPLTLWVFVAIGVLAKGPITPMIVALAAIALAIASRRPAWLLRLRPLLGLAIIAACIGPWVYLVAQRVGWQTYWTTVWKETLGRAGDAAEGHWGPPGYHLVLLPVLFWPGSLLTAAAIGRALHRARRSRWTGLRAEPFLLAWILPAWLVFELTATKLPHYTMPLYPAIALLSARASLGVAARVSLRTAGITGRIGNLIWLAIGAGLIGLVYFIVIATRAGTGSLPIGIVLALGFAMLIVLLGLAAVGTFRIRPAAAQCYGAALMVVWVWIGLLVVLPRAGGLWVSTALARAVLQVDPERTQRVALVGYGEDSAIFLFRGRADRVPFEQLGTWQAAHPGSAVAWQREPGLNDPGPAPSGTRWHAAMRGYNYSTGTPVVIDVYTPEHR